MLLQEVKFSFEWDGTWCGDTDSFGQQDVILLPSLWMLQGLVGEVQGQGLYLFAESGQAGVAVPLDFPCCEVCSLVH